jgi:orotidine-5'-phosphate decarboxylase
MVRPVQPSNPRDRLVFALDVPGRQPALALFEQLREHVGCFKVGLELFVAEGPDLVRELAGRAPIFLDLKLYDIPATVGRAAAAAACLGATYLTVHADEAALRAAAAAAPGLSILAITVLTSVSAEKLARTAGGRSVLDVVLERAEMAQRAGCRGVVCSGQEAVAVRARCGDDLLVVTPGVRPAGTAAGDQARVVTPSAALAAGADMVVVGRPIRDAADPVAAARAIVAELTAGQG